MSEQNGSEGFSCVGGKGSKRCTGHNILDCFNLSPKGHAPMIDRFAAARLKIERANKHIADLDRIVSALPDAYVSTIEPNEKLGQTVKYTPPDVTRMAAEMAVIIYDAIHNLRTAIDYAYVGAIQKHVPYTLDSYTKFPTGETREDV